MPNNDGIKSSLAKLWFALIDRASLLIVLIIATIFASHIFTYPDFAIHPEHPYVDFSMKNLTDVSDDLKNVAKERKDITISAISYPSLPLMKKYGYPIFLNYSFIDENGNFKKQKKGFKVILDPRKRELMVGESANITIEIDANNVTDGEETNIRFFGRGGGGESFETIKSLTETLSTKATGKEPYHFCTITVCISKIPQQITNTNITPVYVRGIGKQSQIIERSIAPKNINSNISY